MKKQRIERLDGLTNAEPAEGRGTAGTKALSQDSTDVSGLVCCLAFVPGSLCRKGRLNWFSRINILEKMALIN